MKEEVVTEFFRINFICSLKKKKTTNFNLIYSPKHWSLKSKFLLIQVTTFGVPVPKECEWKVYYQVGHGVFIAAQTGSLEHTEKIV